MHPSHSTSPQVRPSVRGNIWKLYLLQSIRWFLLIMPVIVLFYRENGLSMAEILLLQAIYSFVMVMFEVPSGYLSDTIGRRNCLILGTVLGAAGFIIYSCSFGFSGFLAAEIVLGFGQCLISGTDAALLYDSLLDTGETETYLKKQGRLTACGNFSEALAGIAGGFLALISLRTNFYAEAAIFMLAIPVAFSLREPAVHLENRRGISLREFFTILSETARSPELCRLISYSSVVLASSLTIVWFVQPYFSQAGLPLVYFGIAWTVLNATVGVSSMAAGHTGSMRIILIAPLLMAGTGYVLLGLFGGLWSCCLFLLIYSARGLMLPVLSDRINRLVGSDRRATVLSIRVLCTRLLFCIAGPLLGWYADHASIRAALIAGGAGFLTLGIVPGLMVIRNRRT